MPRSTVNDAGDRLPRGRKVQGRSSRRRRAQLSPVLEVPQRRHRRQLETVSLIVVQDFVNEQKLFIV